MSEPAPYAASLCHNCQWKRVIISGRGSQFLLCERALTEPRWAKYPPQPQHACSGHVPISVAPPANSGGNSLDLSAFRKLYNH